MKAILLCFREVRVSWAFVRDSAALPKGVENKRIGGKWAFRKICFNIACVCALLRNNTKYLKVF